MYPQCRFVRAAGDGCRAAALKGGHWCYFHQRVLERQATHQETERRQLNRHTRRQHNGRFVAEPSLLDPRPRQLPALSAAPGETIAIVEVSGGHPEQSEGSAVHPQTQDTQTQDTYDYGAYPVGTPGPNPETACLDLPIVEDSASIQIALIDVLQALAANRLDPKRAGLLLYGLQVASANAKNVLIGIGSVRSVSSTSDGTPLGPQEYGWDVEDINEAIDREEAEAEGRD